MDVDLSTFLCVDVSSAVTVVTTSETVVVVTFFDAPVPDAVDIIHTKVPVAVGCVPTYFLKGEPLIVTSVKVGGLSGYAPPP